MRSALLCALALALAAPAAADQLDLDGDGAPEQVTAAADGTIRAAASSGRALGELKAPPHGALAGPTALAVVAAGGRRYLHARAPLAGRGALEQVGELRDGALQTVWAGVTGAPSHDGEAMDRLRVDAQGILRWQTAPGVSRCDGFDQLFPELWDAAARRFRRVSIAPPPGEPLAGRAPPAGLAAPLGLFRFRAASTARGDGGRADRLGAPTELDDRRPDTAWVEGMGGFGRGAFAVARAVAPGQKVTAIAVERPPGDRLTALSIEVGARRFALALPAGARAYAALPEPIAADCVTVSLAAAREDQGDSALAEVAIYTARDGEDLAQLARDLAASAPGSDGLAAVLTAQGERAVAAVRAALPGTSGEGRRKLLRAALAVGGAEAGKLAVEELSTADPEERQLIERALDGPLGDQAAPALAHLAGDRAQPESARAEALALAGRRARGDALAELVALAAPAEGDPAPSLRAAAVRLAEQAPIGEALAAVVRALPPGGPGAGARARMLGAIAARARAAGDPPARAQATREIAAGWPGAGDFAARFRLLRAARQDGASELAPLAADGARDPEPAIRWAAVEAAAALDGDAGRAVLGGALADRDPRVRGAALAGLAARRAPDLGAAASAALAGDRWPLVRRAAAEALERGCAGAEPALEHAARDPSDEVRRAALASLARCAPPRAGTLAIALLEDRTAPLGAREQSAAIAASLRGAEAAAPIARALDEQLDDPHADENAAFLAAALARALGRIADPRGEPGLLRCARSPEAQMRAAAVEALRHFADPPAKQVVRAAWKDPDPQVRRAAGAR